MRALLRDLAAFARREWRLIASFLVAGGLWLLVLWLVTGGRSVSMHP